MLRVGDRRYFLTAVIVAVLLLVLLLVDYFTNLSSKTGELIWYVVLPVVIIGLVWGIFLFLEIKRLFRGRKEIPASELKNYFNR
jgi:hypothetical protein